MRDPANAPFMNSISRGECPRELEPGELRDLVLQHLISATHCHCQLLGIPALPSTGRVMWISA